MLKSTFNNILQRGVSNFCIIIWDEAKRLYLRAPEIDGFFLFVFFSWNTALGKYKINFDVKLSRGILAAQSKSERFPDPKHILLLTLGFVQIRGNNQEN